jgi:RNA polymerase sigma-70 factor (ECF subfamily)
MSAAPLEDALRAAQAGEAWAARVLYDELAPRVVGYLRAKGAAEPEDLTSEVFLTVFGRLGTVTGGVEGLRTFTFSVAHARLVDEIRRRARREPTTTYDAEHDPRTSDAAEEESMLAMQNARVRALLDTLAPDQRDVLVLRILADLSVEQVAEVLRTSQGAVRQRQRRGLLALRKRLERAGMTLQEGVQL